MNQWKTGTDLVCIRVADYNMITLGVATENLTYRNIPVQQQNGRILYQNNLLIEKSGGGEKQPVGRVIRFNLNLRAVCSNFIAKLELSPNTDPNFLVYIFHYLYSVAINTRSIKQTTGIQNLDTGLYFNERLQLPPLPEQSQIATFLHHKTRQIDDLIAKKQRLIELLQEERTALINQAVTKGLDPEVPMKDSGIEWLGEIPEHWKVKKLKLLFIEGKEGIKIGPFGSSLKLEILTESGYKVYGQENVINNDFSIGKRYISDEYYEEMIQYTINEGDIIITMMGTTGKAKVVPDKIEKGIMDSHLIRIRIDKKKFYSPLLALLINDSQSIAYNIKAFSKGSIMEGLNSSIIKSLLIPSSPLKEQIEIYAFLNREVEQIMSIVEKEICQIELLQEYKTSLINEAVTGKIDVRDYPINHARSLYP